jgi:hypothetical protein
MHRSSSTPIISLSKQPLSEKLLCSYYELDADHSEYSAQVKRQADTPPVIASVQPSPEFFARPPQKIAVIVIRLSRDDVPRREIEDVFIRTLISKGFRVVSRSDIKPLQDEIEFQRRSGLTDKDAAKLGRMLNGNRSRGSLSSNSKMLLWFQ